MGCKTETNRIYFGVVRYCVCTHWFTFTPDEAYRHFLSCSSKITTFGGVP